MFRSGVINLQLAVCAEEFRNHHTYLYLLIEARQQKHHYCCLYGSQKSLESLTASLLGRQPSIEPIFSLAAWGGHSPRWWCRARPRRALSRSRGGGNCFDLECILTTNRLSVEFGDSSHTVRGPTRKSSFLRLCKCLEFFNTLVFRHTATDSAHIFASSVG